MMLMFLVRLKRKDLAVDSFSAAMPKVQAGYRKIGVILLKMDGSSLPFSDYTQQ